MEALIDDKDIFDFCARFDRHIVQQTITEANNHSVQARHLEHDNVGRDPEEALGEYYAAAIKYRDAHKMFDPHRIARFRRFKIRYILKDQMIGFSFGVIASLVAAWIVSQFQ